MKKIKIMLMSALVIFVVGGVLAFKAQKLGRGLFCGTTTNLCTIIDEVGNYETIGADVNNHVNNIFCSTNATNNGCTYVTFED